jgi:protein-S-isoprenylcysteine O-methyltransferase Ste14
MCADEQDKAGIVAPPPLIYLGGLFFGLLLGKRFPIAFLPRKIARSLEWPLVGGGLLLMGWFEWTIRRSGTPASPYKPVSHIVTEGPFRYSRNPAYLSMTMIYTGITALANALWAILLLPVVLLGSNAASSSARSAIWSASSVKNTCTTKHRWGVGSEWSNLFLPKRAVH